MFGERSYKREGERGERAELAPKTLERREKCARPAAALEDGWMARLRLRLPRPKVRAQRRQQDGAVAVAVLWLDQKRVAFTRDRGEI